MNPSVTLRSSVNSLMRSLLIDEKFGSILRRRATRSIVVYVLATISAIGDAGCSKAPGTVRPGSLAPASMPRVGTVDERFESYNIEMVEVIGGRFWKPYLGSAATNSNAQPPAQQKDLTPAGIDPNLYQYRAPIDLSNPRLVKLAAALGPAYIRVSGTWANSAYFQDSDNPAAAKAPSGFSGVLTRKEWKGVVDFSHAVGAEIVTSVATGAGARDAHGGWSSEEARRLFEYTKSVGGRIAATEFMNEPTYAAMGGAPKGYDAAAYGRDIQVFRAFLQKSAPGTVFLGPGSVGEGPLRYADGQRSVEIRRPAPRDRPGLRRVLVPSLCGSFAAVRKHGRVIANNVGGGAFAGLALPTREDWCILRGASRQVRAGQITVDHGNG
jgi:hypothetical protein